MQPRPPMPISSAKASACQAPGKGCTGGYFSAVKRLRAHRPSGDLCGIPRAQCRVLGQAKTHDEYTRKADTRAAMGSIYLSVHYSTVSHVVKRYRDGVVRGHLIARFVHKPLNYQKTLPTSILLGGRLLLCKRSCVLTGTQASVSRGFLLITGYINFFV